jgi:hypothetical protein
MGVMIPILALSIPVLAILLGGLQKMQKLRIEEARIRAGSLAGGGDAELEQLRAEVEALRTELGEVHERLDFTERLLTRSREQPPLPGGSAGPG